MGRVNNTVKNCVLISYKRFAFWVKGEETGIMGWVILYQGIAQIKRQWFSKS